VFGRVVFPLILILLVIDSVFASPDPRVFLDDVPSIVDPNEEFTFHIRLVNIDGDKGYATTGVHLHIDSGSIPSFDMDEYTSYAKGTSSGKEWIEFYDGDINPWEDKRAYVTIRAPNDPDGIINIYYRGWMRDSSDCLYRDPDDPDEPDGTCNPQKSFMDYATHIETVLIATITSDIRNLDVSPTTVSPGGTLRVDYEFYGTGGDFPWETQTILIDGEQVACYSDDEEPNQWYPRTRYVSAPSDPGPHTLEVRIYGDNSHLGHCGSFNLGATDSRSFTVESTPPPDPNPDGDDLTTQEEETLSPVFDANNNIFPNSSIPDAYYPTKAAEKFYYKYYYGQNLQNLRCVATQNLIEDETTDNLGALGLYFAKLLQSTNDTYLLSDIPPKLEKVLDQIKSRQVTDDIYYTMLGELRLYNLKGYINSRHPYQKHSWLNDFKTKGFGTIAYDFIRDENPSVTDAYAIQALLEGYLAFKDFPNSTLREKAVEYKNAAQLATDFLIGWHNSRGFNSNPDDQFYYNDLFLAPKLGYGYHQNAVDEREQNAGDRYLGEANVYGTTLNAIATLAVVDPSAIYENNMPVGTPDAHGQSYSTIGNWMVDEIKRFQNYRDGREGGFRVGPLTKDQSGVRLQEQIHYSGFVAFGTRQQYDNNGYGEAYTVVTKLADHWLKIRDPHGDLGKRLPKGGGWFEYWDLDKGKPFQNRNKSVHNEWGAIIMLSGFKDQGFRQAMADMGGFLCSRSSMLNYIFYLSMKMEGDPDIVLPELSQPKCTTYVWMPAYSNPIIFPGEKKKVGFKSDSTIGRMVATMEHEDTSSQLKFYLITPTGEEINSTSYASFEGVSYTVNGTLEYYEVENPASGNWTLVLEAINVPEYGENYKMQAVVGTTLKALLETGSSSYAIGDSVRLVTIMENQEETLTGATITGFVTGPSGETYPIELLDDGTNGDSVANDGYYTTVFTDTDKPGDYMVEITATGTFNGSTYERTASTSFHVMGYTEQVSAYMTGMVHQEKHAPGSTVNALIYVENTGTATIDDELIITIRDISGDIKYRDAENLVLYPDEAVFVRTSWTIPEDTSAGSYILTAEFEDVDALPAVNSFEVG